MISLKSLCIILLLPIMLRVPPSGRPPVGPLQRVQPRVYDFTFDVTVSTLLQTNPLNRKSYHLIDAPIVFPIVLNGTYSKVAQDSLSARLWLDSREIAGIQANSRLDDGLPFHTFLAVIPVPEFRGQSVRWQLSYRTQSWSSVIDDEAAARIPWPNEWPDEIKDGLQPQMFIESGDPIFAETVERISEGKLRLVPPYLAAKDIVRYVIENVQLNESGIRRGAMGEIEGINIHGARYAARNGEGTAHDIVCACVAMLRAAGIPSRPVIGVVEDEDSKRNTIVSWAEFYLPDAGWIPFDPYAMRTKGIRSLNVRAAWPEFGTMRDLNERITMAYHFIPPRGVQTPEHAAIWGWDPRPGGDLGSDQQIRLVTISRGPGEDDPH